MPDKEKLDKISLDGGPGTLRVALEAAGQAMFEYDETGDGLGWTDPDVIGSLLGYSPSEQISSGAAFTDCIHPEDLSARQMAINEARERNESYTVEYRLRGKDGQSRWFEERGSWLCMNDERRLIGMVRTIHDQKVREERLTWLAAYDELTGLLNRPRTREALRRATDLNSEGAYLLIGIDNVGGINNDFGFDVADQVIVEASRRIRKTLEDDVCLGRVAGTKFGAVFSDIDDAGIREVCNRVMAEIRRSVFATTCGGIACSVTIGVSKFGEEKKSADAVMAEAEAALDAAKRIGPSSWTVFSEKTEKVTLRQRNSELSDVILTALNERRVVLAYQPIVTDLNDDRRKYECLIRMRQTDGTEVPAPQFIPAAERLGLVHLLDRRVLELATKTLKANEDVLLNVNVSWETVKDPVWAEGYIAHLRANRDIANRITVELTETQVVDAIEASIEFVSEIKMLGCQFAIDDFGAGYTSFRNLKALDIDVLKIDGSFVTGVSASRENQLFVRTLLDLARNFGMKTVAEWVDNDADAMLLKGLGVDYLQGFYIGKPVQDPQGIIIPEDTRPVDERARIARELF